MFCAAEYFIVDSFISEMELCTTGMLFYRGQTIFLERKEQKNARIIWFLTEAITEATIVITLRVTFSILTRG